MFIGHYGASFVAKKVEPSIPLWVLIVAVQFLDILWAIFVILGLENFRIVEHFTASNPLDMYYMPYTHSLVMAVFWSFVVGIAYQLYVRPNYYKASVIVGLAVFSHWVLDFLVHVPDLPVYLDIGRLGLGLWNMPLIAFGLEIILLFGGIWLCFRSHLVQGRTVLFGAVLCFVQVYNSFIQPLPTNNRLFAMTALAAYLIFPLIVWWTEKPRNA